MTQTLCFTQVHRFLAGLFEGNLHAKRVLSLAKGPSQDWGCDGHLGIFAFVLWPRVDAWLGC